MAVENQTIAPYYSNTRNPYSYEKIEQINRDISTGWLTLDEITQQLNLFQDESQDSYLESLELATRMAIEDFVGFAIFPTTFRVYYGNPGLMVTGTAMYLDLPEVSATYQGQTPGVTINKVSYFTGTGTPAKTTLAASNYFYDNSGSRIVVTNGLPQPLAQNIANPIEVEYTVNSAFAAQYPVVKQAGLMLLTHLYNSRSTVGDSVQMKAEIPFGVTMLLRPYKPLVM
jgi:hypothetical protein